MCNPGSVAGCSYSPDFLEWLQSAKAAIISVTAPRSDPNHALFQKPAVLTLREFDDVSEG